MNYSSLIVAEKFYQKETHDYLYLLQNVTLEIKKNNLTANLYPFLQLLSNNKII